VRRRPTIHSVEIIDTHCHLDVAEFDPDRQSVLARARANGVTAIVVPGVLASGWDYLWRFCTGEPDLYPALGLHPVYLERHQEADLAGLERLLAERRPVAVGEIGLDYFVAGLDRQRQQTLFEAQLEMARAARLPVILHVRKAHDPVLATLKRIGVPGGIAHAYNGSLQQARQYMDLGFKLGFGGMLTYERSRRLRELARQLPEEAIVLETDAPDLTVARHRGSRNSPEYLPDCLAALAEARGESREALACQTSANARAVLGLDSLTRLSG
jgi:TatD DNase family protein